MKIADLSALPFKMDITSRPQTAWVLVRNLLNFGYIAGLGCFSNYLNFRRHFSRLSGIYTNVPRG